MVVGVGDGKGRRWRSVTKKRGAVGVKKGGNMFEIDVVVVGYRLPSKR